jgi:N-acetylglucosamine-6-phosphate deacetylase
MADPAVIAAERVFDGELFHAGRAVAVADGRIVDLIDAARHPNAVRLPRGAVLAPGFIDAQVNGGGGVLLNDEPTVDGIGRIAAAHRRFGTTALLPTLISDRRDVMRRAIRAVGDAIEAGVPGVVGIHLEGPFLNPERKGVHPPDHLVPVEAGDAELVSALGSRGVTLVTLAPERVPPGFVADLVRRGVVVSAGHTDGTAADILPALDEGLTGFTHLFNAMSPLASREPGAVGTALADPRAFAGIIADGHHVADLSLLAAFRAKGPERLMLVTDAMSPVGTGMTCFPLFGREIQVENGRCATADGTLAGAALDMAGAVRHAVRRLGVDLGDALRMASRTPATFLGLDRERGRIAPGFRADLVALDADLQVLATWIGGDVRRTEGEAVR